MIIQVAKTLQVRVNDLNVSVHNQTLDFESNATLKDYNVFNKATLQCGVPPGLEYLQAGHSSLYSRCKDCSIDDCPFEDLVHKWNMHEFSNKQGIRNAYLILCQTFGLPSDVIKIIEDHNEEGHVRLGDVLHRICHKKPNLTQEEVIEIISNGKAL